MTTPAWSASPRAFGPTAGGAGAGPALRATAPGTGLTRWSAAARPGSSTTPTACTAIPRARALIVAATYLALLLLFRSVVLPLKAIVMNTLSILASYGALVVVFQDGQPRGLLGFEPLGFVEASLPIVMFCVLFGLSMDYEVFLLSRVKEAYDSGGDNAASVAVGLEQSGRIITSAALIVVAGQRLLRRRRHRPDQGARPRHRHRRLARRDRRSRACWCPPRCSCWATGTGGRRARLCGCCRRALEES